MSRRCSENHIYAYFYTFSHDISLIVGTDNGIKSLGKNAIENGIFNSLKKRHMILPDSRHNLELKSLALLDKQ